MKTRIVCNVTLALVILSLGNSVLAFAQTREGILPDAPSGKTDKTVRALYWASRGALLGGGLLDGISTERLMSHPTVAYQSDGTVLMRYHGVETGWARCFGARNKFAAVSANMALDAGVDFLSRKIYRKGGRWRILAIAVNTAKSVDNVAAGIHNVQYNASVNRRVELATGYKGQIYWSK